MQPAIQVGKTGVPRTANAAIDANQSRRTTIPHLQDIVGTTPWEPRCLLGELAGIGFPYVVAIVIFACRAADIIVIFIAHPAITLAIVVITGTPSPSSVLFLPVAQSRSLSISFSVPPSLSLSTLLPVAILAIVVIEVIIHCAIAIIFVDVVAHHGIAIIVHIFVVHRAVVAHRRSGKSDAETVRRPDHH